jgi:hypothetical protein
MARLRLLLALCLIGVGTSFGALALSGYYSPAKPQKQINVASTDPKGSQLVRAKPRQRFVAADTPAVPQRTTTPTIVPTTTQANVEVLPWAKSNAPVIKSPPREVANKPKDPPRDQVKEAKETRPKQAAASPWPWSLFSY